jgi:ABC-type glycerol-3-phosphate transport system permease component
MGTASKVVSVFFRFMELSSASIVAGILGAYLHYIDDAHVGKNGRIIYSIVIAGISIFFSLVLAPPLRYSFYAFPFDFAMFVCWIVAFGLLINVCCHLMDSPSSAKLYGFQRTDGY